jgi:hypothetical protein
MSLKPESSKDKDMPTDVDPILSQQSSSKTQITPAKTTNTLLPSDQLNLTTPFYEDPLMAVANEKTSSWWERSAALSFFINHQKFLTIVMMLSFSILLIGGLIISHLKAEHGLMVFASDPLHWRAGRQVSIRVEARTLTFAQNIYLTDVTIRWLDNQKQIHHHQTITQHVGPFIQGNITTPKRSGTWTLQLYAKGLSPKKYRGSRIGSNEGFDDLKRNGREVELIASTEVHLRDPSQSEAWVWPGKAMTPETTQARQGEGVISIFALHQNLSFELSSDMVVVAQDEQDQPWQGDIQMKLIEGTTKIPTPTILTTDMWGITQWKNLAQSPTLSWTHQAQINTKHPSSVSKLSSIKNSLNKIQKININQVIQENQKEAQQEIVTMSHERVWPKAHQVSLTTNAQWVKPAGRLHLEIESLGSTPIVYLDLWHQGVWIYTQALKLRHKKASFNLDIPIIEHAHMIDQDPSLYWIQAYTTPYMPGENKAGRYLLSPALNTTPNTTLKTIPKDSFKTEDDLKKSTGQWLAKLLIQHQVEPHHYWHQIPAEVMLQPPLLSLALGRIKAPQSDPQLIINSTHSAQASMQHLKAQYQKVFMIMMSIFCAILCTMMAWMMWVHHQNFKHSEVAQLLYQNSQQVLWTWFIPVAFILILFFTGLISLVFLMKW